MPYYLTILIVLSCLIFHRISKTPHRNTLVNTNMFIVGRSCVNINLPVVSLARDFYQEKQVNSKFYRSTPMFDRIATSYQGIFVIDAKGSKLLLLL